MAHSNPKHSDQTPTNAQLKSALSLIAAEITRDPLRSSFVSRIMRDTFGGSDASGAWNWRMAYDMMQAAAVITIMGDGDGVDPLATAKPLAMRLLTETRRSEQQIRLQQFSTPLPYAALAVRAAAIRTGETVLEPSAGTGSLAGFAKQKGTKLLLNEVDLFRQRLLDVVFDAQTTGHDAEHIDDLLTSPTAPSVIVMNPPFASSVDRSRDKHIAAKHLIGAAKRLASGGRLVAIMPMGFTLERDAAHWTRAMSLLTPRLALTIPGHVYRKLGTSVDTQLMVFDKVQDDHKMIRVSVEDLDAAVSVVEQVATTRPIVAPVTAPRPKHVHGPLTRSEHSTGRKPAETRVAAAKTPKHAARPLLFTTLETPRENTPISEIYARYRPQRIDIAGAQEHPTPLVESIAMASVAPPVPSLQAAEGLRLPNRLIAEGHLSEAQLETIIMAPTMRMRATCRASLRSMMIRPRCCAVMTTRMRRLTAWDTFWGTALAAVKAASARGSFWSIGSPGGVKPFGCRNPQR